MSEDTVLRHSPAYSYECSGPCVQRFLPPNGNKSMYGYYLGEKTAYEDSSASYGARTHNSVHGRGSFARLLDNACRFSAKRVRQMQLVLVGIP